MRSEADNGAPPPSRVAPAALADRLGELSARIHAATAELVALATEFDGLEGWAGDGIRSCAHWLSIATGCDARTAVELLRAGQTLRTLPRFTAAFAEGRLSFDKVRAATLVATPADEEMWLEVALHASGAQLTRICRAARRVLDLDAPGHTEGGLARRGLHHWWRDDGMLQLTATLPPEDGAVVLAAIAAALPELPAPPRPVAPSPLDPAEDPFAARRADALRAVCARALGATTASHGRALPELVVHVDAAALVGPASPAGTHRAAAGGLERDWRCGVDNGPAVSAATARRIGCDATVVAITERDGVPLDVGRARRVVSGRLRRALQVRDTTCRFPGCLVPAEHTHGHHIRHWIDGGRTDLANLLSLCGFHHRRLHDGAYAITLGPDHRPQFLAADGRPITPGPHPTGNPLTQTALLAAAVPIAPGTARAMSRGAPCDFAYVIETLTCAAQMARTRAGPGA